MFDINQSTTDYMSVVLTHECNKKCPFCIDRYRGNSEFLSPENVEVAIRFGRKQGIKDILLVGGEPTLHPNVIGIANAFKQAGFRVILTTNYTRPEVFAKLDGLVDCFNVSFYGQKTLPVQALCQSDVTLTTLIHSKQLETREKLDSFIDNHRAVGHLKFSTLTVCNDWTRDHQKVDYLDNLPCEWVVLFNEILGQQYRNTIIKRYDRQINNNAVQSFKFHVDGNISTSWIRS